MLLHSRIVVIKMTLRSQTFSKMGDASTEAALTITGVLARSHAALSLRRVRRLSIDGLRGLTLATALRSLKREALRISRL